MEVSRAVPGVAREAWLACALILQALWILFPAGTFRLTLEFSEDYPNKAPVVKFKSTMFHPNSEFAARRWCVSL